MTIWVLNCLMLFGILLQASWTRSIQVTPLCNTDEDHLALGRCLRPFLDSWELLRTHEPIVADVVFPTLFYTRDQILTLCDFYFDALDNCLNPQVIQSCKNSTILTFVQSQVGFMCTHRFGVKFLSMFDCISEALTAKPSCGNYIKGLPLPELQAGKCKNMPFFFSCLQKEIYERCSTDGLVTLIRAIEGFGCDSNDLPLGTVVTTLLLGNAARLFAKKPKPTLSGPLPVPAHTPTPLSVLPVTAHTTTVQSSHPKSLSHPETSAPTVVDVSTASHDSTASSHLPTSPQPDPVPAAKIVVDPDLTQNIDKVSVEEGSGEELTLNLIEKLETVAIQNLEAQVTTTVRSVRSESDTVERKEEEEVEDSPAKNLVKLIKSEAEGQVFLESSEQVVLEAVEGSGEIPLEQVPVVESQPESENSVLNVSSHLLVEAIPPGHAESVAEMIKTFSPDPVKVKVQYPSEVEVVPVDPVSVEPWEEEVPHVVPQSAEDPVENQTVVPERVDPVPVEVNPVVPPAVEEPAVVPTEVKVEAVTPEVLEAEVVPVDPVRPLPVQENVEVVELNVAERNESSQEIPELGVAKPEGKPSVAFKISAAVTPPPVQRVCSSSQEEQIRKCFLPLSEIWESINAKKHEIPTDNSRFSLFQHEIKDLSELCEVLDLTFEECLTPEILQNCRHNVFLQYVNGHLGLACGSHSRNFFKSYDCLLKVQRDSGERCLAHLKLSSPVSPVPPEWQKCIGMPQYYNCMEEEIARSCEPSSLRIFLDSIHNFGCDIRGDEKKAVVSHVFSQVESEIVHANIDTEVQFSELNKVTSDESKSRYRKEKQFKKIPVRDVPLIVPELSERCTPQLQGEVRTCMLPLMEVWVDFQNQKEDLKNLTFAIFSYEKREILALCDEFANGYLNCDLPLFEVCVNDEMVRFANDNLAYICSPQNVQSFLRHFHCISEQIKSSPPECRELIEGINLPGQDEDRCYGMGEFYQCVAPRITQNCGSGAIFEFEATIVQFGCRHFRN